MIESTDFRGGAAGASPVTVTGMVTFVVASVGLLQYDDLAKEKIGGDTEMNCVQCRNITAKSLHNKGGHRIADISIIDSRSWSTSTTHKPIPFTCNQSNSDISLNMESGLKKFAATHP